MDFTFTLWRLLESAEFILFVIGIVALIIGRIGIPGGSMLKGWPARLVGLILASILPLTVALLFLAAKWLDSRDTLSKSIQTDIEFFNRMDLAEAKLLKGIWVIALLVLFTLLACAGVVVWGNKSDSADDFSMIEDVPPKQ